VGASQKRQAAALTNSQDVLRPREASVPNFFFGVEKSTAYKAPGAEIEGVPATSVSPEIDLMSALSVMAASSRGAISETNCI